jgi:hypothetical protein
MDEIAAVGQVHRFGQSLHQSGCVAGRQYVPGQPLGQRTALDELHDEIRPAIQLPAVVDLDDVRMAEAGHRLGLPQEPTQLLRQGVRAGQQHLQGDGAIQAEVADPVHGAHAAVTEHRLHLVAGDRRQAGSELPGRDRVPTGEGSGLRE